MDTFLKAMAGSFIGRVLAVTFITACTLMGLGPDKWAAWLINGLPTWITPFIARMTFLALGAIVLVSFLIGWIRRPGQMPPNKESKGPKPDPDRPHLRTGIRSSGDGGVYTGNKIRNQDIGIDDQGKNTKIDKNKIT